MPRGDKSSYTKKQQRMAEHIEEGAQERGATEEQAERIAWATVNKYTGGAMKRKSSSAIKRSKPEAKIKKASPKRTGPAKTTGSTHRKLSVAGKKGAAAAARSVGQTAVKKRAAAKKASASRSKSATSGGRSKSTGTRRSSAKRSTRKSTSKGSRR